MFKRICLQSQDLIVDIFKTVQNQTIKTWLSEMNTANFSSEIYL